MYAESSKDLTTSKNSELFSKLGFFFAFLILFVLLTTPPHSISILGLLMADNWNFFIFRTPQVSTCFIKTIILTIQLTPPSLDFFQIYKPSHVNLFTVCHKSVALLVTLDVQMTHTTTRQGRVTSIFWDSLRCSSPFL